ncbi:Anti-sigma regulatory factor (Ser/Thr protein kinase) [Klenkia marina]|uniref:Anti-sigma regulatory factor (Ser/Thr protein kinase) n=1 Tax=Klenkia marina TaxID=1960309 RepID=A0A1G4Z5H4_9ACTN|nr:ATP-binding protein [Klenkia marina]SCX60892.1 Anti-sigma regulatory factor (Ser/Thr protein kinase) [Klenkia marina]
MALEGYRHVAGTGGPDASSGAALLPALRAGLAAGSPVVLACSSELRAGLETELTGDPVHVIDPDELAGRAPDALAGYTALLDRLSLDGSRLQLVTDSVCQAKAGVVAWLQTEALLNHVLADRAVDHYCVVDPRQLGDDLPTALACHPLRLADGSPAVNPGFREPAEVLRSLWTDPGPDPVEATPPTLSIDDVGSMRELRRALTASLADGPLHPDEAEDLVLAIDEVVSNAAEHGVPPVDVRLWVTAQRVLCAVADRGAGFDEPLAGYGPAHGTDLSVGGMGLWLARRAVDRMTTSPLDGGDGCVVRLTIDPRR